MSENFKSLCRSKSQAIDINPILIEDFGKNLYGLDLTEQINFKVQVPHYSLFVLHKTLFSYKKSRIYKAIASKSITKSCALDLPKMRLRTALYKGFLPGAFLQESPQKRFSRYIT